MRTQSRIPVATGCGIATAAAMAVLPPSRHFPGLFRDTGVAFQVPHRHRGRLLVVDRRFVEAAHAAGRHVHVWTIDDPKEIELLVELGVDGIFTDRPDVLRDVLVRLGVWDGAP